MKMGKVILPGGSGFLGRMLARWFSEKNYEVVVLSRKTNTLGCARTLTWDGETLGEWKNELEGALAVINLAGRSVDCRYHARNRRLMMDSRVQSTRVIGEAIQGCALPPKAWLNSSTATIYEHTYGTAHTEMGRISGTPDVKDGFSVEIATAWEKTFHEAKCPSTRKIALRTAMVLDREPGTVYAVLKRLTRWGLGGKMGHGKQYVSWIHADDFCRTIHWLVSKPSAEGVYNICAPNPLPNEELMATMRKAFKMSFGLPSFRWMLELGAWVLRTETELVIKSRRVVPARLLADGFTFRCPHFLDALYALEKTDASARA